MQLSGADDTFAPWKFSNPWFGTLRARAGVAMSNVLFYGTVGSRLRHLEAAKHHRPACPESQTNPGWAGGVGMEVALTGNWTRQSGIPLRRSEQQLLRPDRHQPRPRVEPAAVRRQLSLLTDRAHWTATKLVAPAGRSTLTASSTSTSEFLSAAEVPGTIHLGTAFVRQLGTNKGGGYASRTSHSDQSACVRRHGCRSPPICRGRCLHKAPAMRAGRLQLDRLLSRHQRRLRLGPFELGRLRRRRRCLGRPDRPDRRLQLAGPRQSVGVRPRRRHRLERHQGSFANAACPTGCETRNNWLGTVRGRVGYAFDRVMPYVTGGLAVGDIEANQPGFAGVSDTNVGWTVGGGIEAAIASNWTAKLEYLYVDLGDVSCSAGSARCRPTSDFQRPHRAGRSELPVLTPAYAEKRKPRTPVRGFLHLEFAKQNIRLVFLHHRYGKNTVKMWRTSQITPVISSIRQAKFSLTIPVCLSRTRLFDLCRILCVNFEIWRFE